jgi:N-acetylmuramoyl-L-alanine amidase
VSGDAVTIVYKPEVIERPSPNYSTRVFDRRGLRPGSRVDTVLLHHTASPSDALGTRNALNWMCNRMARVSAHYLVGHAGDVYRLVPEPLKAWHAGKGRLPWETCEPYDFNHRSIGIEIVNPGDGKTPFTEAQYRALCWLVPNIVRRQEWTSVAVAAGDGFDALAKLSGKWAPGQGFVLGHRDVAPGRKTDPADNFDWGRIREALAGDVS